VKKKSIDMLAIRRLRSPIVSVAAKYQQRCLSSAFSFVDSHDDDMESWPRGHANTVVNVCPQGEMMIVERLGKMSSIHQAGMFFAVPLIDIIRFRIDMREKALNILPQSAITKDNVHVRVSGNLYCQFVDAQKAAYGCKNPIYAVKQHAQSAMRAAIGELELDQILHARAQLNQMIRGAVQEAAQAWGLEIKRYEITDISPDKHITDAMDKQAAAERERRKKVLEAEGDKKSAELQSEGMKIRLQNESEGMLVKVKNEALARKVQYELEAEGEASAIEKRAKAQAIAIQTIARTLEQSESSREAAKLYVAKQYMDMYSEIGSKSNTMIFSDRPGDINALLAQVGLVLNSTVTNGNKKVTTGANRSDPLVADINSNSAVKSRNDGDPSPTVH